MQVHVPKNIKVSNPSDLPADSLKTFNSSLMQWLLNYFHKEQFIYFNSDIIWKTTFHSCTLNTTCHISKYMYIHAISYSKYYRLDFFHTSLYSLSNYISWYSSTSWTSPGNSAYLHPHSYVQRFTFLCQTLINMNRMFRQLQFGLVKWWNTVVGTHDEHHSTDTSEKFHCNPFFDYLNVPSFITCSCSTVARVREYRLFEGPAGLVVRWVERHANCTGRCSSITGAHLTA